LALVEGEEGAGTQGPRCGKMPQIERPDNQARSSMMIRFMKGRRRPRPRSIAHVYSADLMDKAVPAPNPRLQELALQVFRNG
jgi:hypothetical protein